MARVCNMDCFNCPYPDCIREESEYPASWIYANRPEEYKQRNRQQSRERYKRLKAAGLCVACGAKPARKGHSYCLECGLRAHRVSKEQAEMAKRERQDRRAAKIAAGLCVRVECTRPAEPGHKLCAEHGEQCRGYLRKAREVLSEQAREDYKRRRKKGRAV